MKVYYLCLLYVAGVNSDSCNASVTGDILIDAVTPTCASVSCLPVDNCFYDIYLGYIEKIQFVS